MTFYTVCHPNISGIEAILKITLLYVSHMLNYNAAQSEMLSQFTCNSIAESAKQTISIPMAKVLLIIDVLGYDWQYSFLCLHSAQTLVFCRCMHAEYNNNCLENPLGPASGCAMLC